MSPKERALGIVVTVGATLKEHGPCTPRQLVGRTYGVDEAHEALLQLQRMGIARRDADGRWSYRPEVHS